MQRAIWKILYRCTSAIQQLQEAGVILFIGCLYVQSRAHKLFGEILKKIQFFADFSENRKIAAPPINLVQNDAGGLKAFFF